MKSGGYENKIALVTGSSRGIGELIAQHFLENGATVIGVSRGDAAISSPNYSHYKIDITDADAVEAFFFKLERNLANWIFWSITPLF